MSTRTTILLILIPTLLTIGCSDEAPVVNSKADLAGLVTSITSLHARGLADNDIGSLARFKDLQVLDFTSGNGIEPARITDSGLAKIAKLKLPHLDTLNLGWCDEISDVGLAHIGRIETLTWLGLTSCPKITDAGLRESIHAKGPIGLDLRGNPNITDDGIQQLAPKADWKSIELGGCPKITRQGVARLQAALPNTTVNKDEAEWAMHAPHSRSWRKN